MSTNIYNKIVRSKMPEIIEEKGNVPDFAILHNESTNIVEKFKNKIMEEANELLNAKSSDEIIEEAADLYQVILDYISLKKYSKEDLEIVRNSKVIKRGAFLNSQGSATFLKEVKNK